MVKLQVLFFVCLHGAMIFTVSAQVPSSRISISEAKKLVSVAIYPNKSDAELDEMDNPYEHDFVFFEAIDKNPSHAAHMGTFAVNIWTGDVWNTAGFCSRLTSMELKAMQEGIRARSKLSAAAFNRFHAKKPICDAD